MTCAALTIEKTVVSPDVKSRETAMTNIGTLLNCDMVRGKSSNDAMSLRNNLLLGIASIRPAETADDEAKAEFEKEMRELKQTMNLTKAARRALDKMCDVRSDLFTSPDKHKLTLLQQTRRRYEARKINSALIKDFHVWLYTQCPLVINSPNKHDVIKTIDDNGEKVELRKFFYLFSQREVYNCAIKDIKDGGFPGFYEPNSSSDKIWISRSTMEKILPMNLRRMTDSQKQMCGCEICIDGRAMFQSLLAWRNRQLINYDKAIASLIVTWVI